MLLRLHVVANSAKNDTGATKQVSGEHSATNVPRKYVTTTNISISACVGILGAIFESIWVDHIRLLYMSCLNAFK
jgi:hypothetical protein